MAIAELMPRLPKGAVETYSGLRDVSRIRLTAEETRHLRYVLCEWSGEVTGQSSAAQLEKLAEDPALLKQVRSEKEGKRRMRMAIKSAWRRAWAADEQEIGGSSSGATKYHGWEMTPADRWCNIRFGEGRRKREGALHAWRALRLMSSAGSRALVILNALYGDRPPGLLDGVLWDKSVNAEYVRVVRFAEDGGSAASLEARLHVDRRAREGESHDSYRTRHGAATSARAALLKRLGQQCERLIVAASVEYRQAWSES